MNTRLKTVLSSLFLVPFLAASVMALDQTPAPTRAAPEAPTTPSKQIPEALLAKRVLFANEFMIVSAHPLASEAGFEMLKKGGSVVDAAIATQLVLGLVEPQSSGLGGGGFALTFQKKTGKTTAYDGRETAPAAVKPNHFLKENGRPFGFGQAISSGLSIGVPGIVAMLDLAHKQEGNLAWADLFAPAIALSENGFKVSRRLHALLKRKGPKHFNKNAQALYFDSDGAPRPIGFLLKNPAYGASLKQIATQGAKGFYQGTLAQAIVKAAQNAPLKPSTMTLADLATYKPQQGSPLCTSYRRLNVCGSPLPSSGGLTIAQSLKLLEPFNLSDPKTPFLTQLKRVLDAQKLAFADRNHYMADPAFVPPPKGLLSEPYMQTRRGLFPLPNNGDKAPYGTPEKKKSSLGVDSTIEASGTTHISIVDKEGNGISLTSSIESAFGSGQMAGGFLLNNQLTDFSFKPTDIQGRPIANRVEGGKRPRSSMSPTLVFDEQKNLKYVLGSPGGSRIIGYVLKSLIAMVDWGQTPQQAASLFNFANRNGLMELEASFNAQWIAKDLTAHKIPFRKASMTSGIHIIERKNGQLISGTDPRREGIAKGQ